MRIVEKRASGLILVHAGYVCGPRPVELAINVQCPDETELSGTVWRMPDRDNCGWPPPEIPALELQAHHAVRIAVLRKQTIFRGARAFAPAGDCDDAPPEARELWPPVVAESGWREDSYWTDPDDAVYQLQAN